MKGKAARAKETIQSLPMRLVKAGYLYTLAMLALGIVLTFWPTESVWWVYRVSSVLLMAVGVVRIIKYFRSNAEEAHEHMIFARGAILVLGGILLLIYRYALVDLVPVLVATVLLFVACIRTQAAFDLKCYRHRLWFVCTIVAGIQSLLALLSVLLVMPLISTVLIFCGVGLLLEGLADLYTRIVVGKLRKMGLKPDDPKVVFSLKPRPKAEKPEDSAQDVVVDQTTQAEAPAAAAEEPAAESAEAPAASEPEPEAAPAENT